MSKDCYWYVDARLEKPKQTMKSMCTECHKTHNFGWFWLGSIRGYGNYDLDCAICGTILHRQEQEQEKHEED